MARIKIGVNLPPQRTSFAEYRQAWLQADALGVESSRSGIGTTSSP
jgi:hypothetical protein